MSQEEKHCPLETCTLFECKSVRSKVVSIEGRFDRQKSIRSKTRVSSIEDCNYCLSVLNLLFMKSVEKYFLIQLKHS